MRQRQKEWPIVGRESWVVSLGRWLLLVKVRECVWVGCTVAATREH